jgi:cation diffusion facilitator CzcD-associated flavoprotein CzcO
MTQTAISAAREAVKLDVVVIGAGFSGLYQLHILRDELAMNVLLLEAGEGVGGTWFWNRYPGARCDSESFYYSYSFSNDLQNEWQWSERYPEQKEILSYLNHVADRFDLRRSIRLQTRAVSAHFDDVTGRWLITTRGGQKFDSQFLISAVGCLSAANVPNIPGLDSFKGRWLHTARWPQEPVDFTGKRVGIIGTGSTGIQATPVIAEQAAHLTVFQRTANYSLPAQNAKLTPEFIQDVRQNYDRIRARARSTINGHPFDTFEKSALDVGEAERLERYEAAWKRGGLRFLGVFCDLFYNLQANNTAADFIRGKIASIVKDPTTAAKLMPRDHPFATKRPVSDTNYFETFNRENVSLVDVKVSPISAITPTGIRTTDAEYPLDIIVFATGFDAMTGPLLAIDIRGRGGRTLKSDWAGGARTYLGLQIAGYPNLFTITGPGSPSVLSNMPVAIEQHVQWITACLKYMREHGLALVETTQGATDSWVEQVNAAAHATLLPLATSSWYWGANIPGKPRVFLPYAGGMARYAAICFEVAEKGYEGFVFNRAGSGAALESGFGSDPAGQSRAVAQSPG